MSAAHRPSAWIALGVFLVTFLVYVIWPGRFSSGDNRWILPTALSLLHQGDAELSEFKGVMNLPEYSLYTDAEGRLYNYFPLGSSLVIMPPALLAELLVERTIPGINLYEHTQAFRALGAEQVIASVVTAAAVALFYVIAATYLNTGPALWVTLIFAFGTGAWSMTSRTLWMHGPLILVFVALLLSLLRARQRVHWLVLAGFLTGLSYVIRPTASVWVLVISAYVLWQYRPRSLWYFAGAALVAGPFLLHNLTVYGMLLPPYYESSRLGLHEHFGEALLGNLISPSRGVFLFSPVLLIAFWGAYTHWRRGRWQALDSALWIGMGLHWIAVSSFPGWWGGTSNGPRFMLDILPFLMLYIVYAAVNLFESAVLQAEPHTAPPHTAPRTAPRRSLRHAPALSLFALLTAVSVFIHGSMAISPAAQEWDTVPMNIERDQSRLWDWLDLPFLRPYRALENTPTLLQLRNLNFEFDHPFDLYVAEGVLQWVETTPSGRNFQWMSTPSVVFYLPLRRDRALNFELAIASVIQPELLDTFELLVNDVTMPLTQIDEIEGMPVYSVTVPRTVLGNRNAYTRIELKVERTYRPADLGISDDTRDVSVALDYLRIRPARQVNNASG